MCDVPGVPDKVHKGAQQCLTKLADELVNQEPAEYSYSSYIIGRGGDARPGNVGRASAVMVFARPTTHIADAQSTTVDFEGYLMLYDASALSDRDRSSAARALSLPFKSVRSPVS